MFKQELPLMFPGRRRRRGGARRDVRPVRVLHARDKDGLLKTDFKTALGKVAYHIPCHSRVQNIGRKTAEMLECRCPATSR